MRLRLFALTLFAISATAAVKVDKTSYGGWPNCYRLSNGEVELIVTTDIGPRVIRYGFVGGQNLFKEFKEQIGKSGEKTWQARGGHRVWVAPEITPITYALDNGPVKAEIKGDSIELTQPVEPETGYQKQMVVRLAPTGTKVEVTHRIKNVKGPVRDVAPWSLTMMATGGMAFTGFPPRGKHEDQFLPTNPLVMWAYTDLSDKRYTFTKKYLMLRQETGHPEPQKVGTFNTHTWAAYLLGSDLFVKEATADPKKAYPDMGASFETYSDVEFLEMETLGPLQKLEAGKTMEHVEHWSLHKNMKAPQLNDAALDKFFQPILGK